MQFYVPEPMSGLSRWTSRLALFSVLIVVSAAVLHRLFGMPTLVAFTLVKAALLGAIVSLLLGLCATVGIWRTGRAGAARVFFGAVLSLGLLMLPILALYAAHGHPALHDVTTDTNSPPEFVVLAKVRGPGSNPATYPGETAARVQSASFPDIQPMQIDRAATETYELAREAARRLDLKIVREDPPGESGRGSGVIEAIDRTLVFGFYDDVVIRVTGDEERARIDLRSSSRYGSRDFGANADRLRSLMKEIVARLEETVPSAEALEAKKNKANLKDATKADKEGDQKSPRLRKPPTPARSDAQRAQERKARQPALD